MTMLSMGITRSGGEVEIIQVWDCIEVITNESDPNRMNLRFPGNTRNRDNQSASSLILVEVQPDPNLGQSSPSSADVGVEDFDGGNLTGISDLDLDIDKQNSLDGFSPLVPDDAFDAVLSPPPPLEMLPSFLPLEMSRPSSPLDLPLTPPLYPLLDLPPMPIPPPPPLEMAPVLQKGIFSTVDVPPAALQPFEVLRPLPPLLPIPPPPPLLRLPPGQLVSSPLQMKRPPPLSKGRSLPTNKALPKPPSGGLAARRQETLTSRIPQGTSKSGTVKSELKTVTLPDSCVPEPPTHSEVPLPSPKVLLPSFLKAFTSSPERAQLAKIISPLEDRAKYAKTKIQKVDAFTEKISSSATSNKGLGQDSYPSLVYGSNSSTNPTPPLQPCRFKKPKQLEKSGSSVHEFTCRECGQLSTLVSLGLSVFPCKICNNHVSNNTQELSQEVNYDLKSQPIQVQVEVLPEVEGESFSLVKQITNDNDDKMNRSVKRKECSSNAKEDSESVDNIQSKRKPTISNLRKLNSDDLKCVQCDKKFQSKSQVQAHLSAKKCSRNVKNLLSCSKCSEEFEDENEVRSHVQFSHPKECWKCPKCLKVMLTPEELSVHFKEDHNPNQRLSKRKSSQFWKYFVYCEMCLDRIPISSVRNHIEVKHGIKVKNDFKSCPVCEAEIENLEHWVEHLHMKHNTPVEQLLIKVGELGGDGGSKAKHAKSSTSEKNIEPGRPRRSYSSSEMGQRRGLRKSTRIEKLSKTNSTRFSDDKIVDNSEKN